MLTRLRMERLKRGMTQQQLAEVTGVHNAEISKFETGRLKPYPRQANVLAAVFGIDPASLLEEVR